MNKSEDGRFIIWFHDGVHGTKGYVEKHAEWDGVIEGESPSGEHFTVGMKRKSRLFKPCKNGITFAGCCPGS